MSEGFVSASTETQSQVARMQGQIDGIEEQIQTLITTGNTLANEAQWAGKDADAFKGDWPETSRKLTQAVTVLRSINVGARDSANSIMGAGGYGPS
ncbi:MAG: WXG100 family type VII secretion target [Acidimicrobiales bacterium]